ncbi:retrovirus-related pol polyprotein from transposon TNT 1-94 [Tanacetum coccineum]
MSGTIPPIPPPPGTTGNPNPNRINTIPNDTINTTTTTNVAQTAIDENLLKLLDSRGDIHVTNVPEFDKEDFTSWKVRFLVFLDGLEPYLLKTLEDGPFIPMSCLSTSSNPLPKHQNQWSNAESRLANQCKTAKKIWYDLILTHEGPSDTRDTKIAALRLKFNAFKSLEGVKVNRTFTKLKCLLNDLENNGVIIPQAEVNATDSDVEEDHRTNNEFMADLNTEYHESALLANHKRFYKGLRGLVQLGNRWTNPKRSVSLVGSLDYKGKYKGLKAQMAVLTKRIDDLTKGKKDEGTTKIKAFISISEDELSVGKADARYGQWVEIIMKKSELCNLKNTMSINYSLQNEVIKVNLENESLNDEIYDLKKVIKKWTCSKVTLDQLLSEQVLGNIVKAPGGRGRRKEKISSKEVIFTKADESSSMSIPKITSESECETQEPLPPLLKLIGVEPADTSKSLTSLADLTPNMADLTPNMADMTLNTSVPKKTKPTSDKVSPTHAIKKKTKTKSSTVPALIYEKKGEASIENLLLTLMEEVKSLKEYIKVPSDNSLSVSQIGSSKSSKGKVAIRLKVMLKSDMVHVTSSGRDVGGEAIKMVGISYEVALGTIFNQNDKVVLIAPRRRDVYVIDMSSYNSESNTCFFAKASPSVNWLWHKRQSHLNLKNINNLVKHNLVSGLPSLAFSKDKNCSACEKRKHHRASFKTKRSFSINKCLHLLHMDLFGLVKPQTISHNKYTLVIIDEYSRYTWVFCLKKKSDAADCISQNFSSPCTPEQNGGAKRRNITLIEAARTMLNSAKLPKQFWREAVNTACYTQNRSIIVKRHGKTVYDVFKGRSHDISYFYMFGCHVHIHNHKDHLGKFDEKPDDGFFLGYSPVAKVFRVFNIRRQEMEETYHVTFSEDNEAISQSSTEEPHKFTSADNHLALSELDHLKLANNLKLAEFQDTVINEPISEVQPLLTNISPLTDDLLQPFIPQDRWSREKHIELVNIIGEPLAGIITRRTIRDSKAASAHECLYVNFLYEMEPKKLIEALEE